MRERWIAHNQEGMPKRLKPWTRVVLMYRKGKSPAPEGEAGKMYWYHDNDCCDIIAYKIVE